MEKAIAYLRVSTKEQNLERQHNEIKEFAKSKNLDLVKIFEDVISASKKRRTDRDGFNKMQNYITFNKSIKHLLVIEISRLGRQQLDVLNAIDAYHKKGINVHIKDLDLSTLDDDGEKSYLSGMVISLLAKMAENEVRLLSERIKSGKKAKAKKGVSFSSKITGYKKNKDGLPIVDEDKAPIVKRIFELASNDIGMRSISDILFKEYNKVISTGTLSGIIRNSFYKGEREGKNRNIQIEPLVSSEIWDKANTLVQNRKQFKSRRYVHPNIVQGKIFCGVCGSPMYQIVIIKARNNIYSCKDTKCKNSLNRPWLQEAIKQVIENYAAKVKDEDVRKQISEEINLLEIRVVNLTSDFNKQKSIKTNLTISYASEKIEEVDYKNAIEIVVSKIHRIENDIKYYKAKIKNLYTTLDSDIEHFSNDLFVLKKQIKHILKSVKVFKNDIEINLTFASIILKKPNSAKLGWLTRKYKNNKQLGNLLTDATYITDEELENLRIMVSNLDINESEIDNYFNSEEYKNKVKGVRGLGGKK